MLKKMAIQRSYGKIDFFPVTILSDSRTTCTTRPAMDSMSIIKESDVHV